MVQIANETSSYESKSDKISLLRKYDIPVDHLEFSYIDNCTNDKELEHILKILRSGEEGHYPHLIDRAEKRLKTIKPHSKLLRTVEPVFTKQSLNIDDWNNVTKEIQEWSSEIKKVDSNLQKSKKKIESDLPAIRKREMSETDKNVNPNNVNKTRIASCDYEGWEKYDPDVELLKEDIEEERYKNELKKSKELETKKKKSVVFNLSHNLTDEESTVLATKEKECGNEYYRIEDYEEAKRFYTKSILIKPTTIAYNNRCATNLKLKKYKEALQDSESVLKIEPNNVKALVRKAQAFHFIGELSKALITLENVISLEPQNNFAQKLISEIQKQLPTKKEKTVRLMIEDCNGTCENKGSNSNNVCIKLNHCKKVDNFVKIVEIQDEKKLSNKEQKTKKVIIPIPSTSSYCGPSIKIVELPVSSDNTTNKKSPEKQVQLKKEMTEANSSMSKKEDKLSNERAYKRDVKNVSKKSIFTDSRADFTEISAMENVNLSDPRTCGEPFPQSINNNNISAPYEFIKLWQAIQNINNISDYARILRRVSPLNLSLVIGNKLDSEMLSTLLKCLEYHFLIPSDVHLVALFMTNICYLPRFNIVAMFLEENDKITIRNILSFLRQHGEGLSGDVCEMIREYVR